ncbi:hypothetical protein CC2G_005460 [Coprinopsis cinerea AmutBmut pab1-1]|nr:hypothetical protein CC2G_005460 [Coprinopsis cinerea AmutBmut pab1-1]
MAPQYTDPYSTNARYYYQNDSFDFNDPTRGGPGTTSAYPHHQPYDSYSGSGPTYDPYSSSNLNNQQYPPADMSQPQHSRSQSQSQRVTYEDGNNAELGRQPSTLRRSSTKRTEPGLAVAPVRKQWNGFEAGEFTPVTPRNRKGLKEYRYDTQGNLWTKGSRGRCIGRFLCCTIMITILLVVSIVLALALWIRPPAIDIGDVVTHNTTGSLSSPDGLEINLSVPISVNNPNYFTVAFSLLKVEIFYPINNTPVGGGESRDIVFKSGEETDFTFPFKLSYRTADDPGNRVFVDLGTKCGVGGGRRENISVNYKLTLGIRIMLITISPVIENTFTFQCPQEIVNGASTVITGTTTSSN